MDRATASFPDYQSTSGRFLQMLQRIDGKQAGDPDRAAAIIVGMVHRGQAPLRLPLGKYAVGKIRKLVRSRESDLAEWEATAVSADFPE